MTTNNIANERSMAFSSAFINALLEAIIEASGSPWQIESVPDVELPPEGSEFVRVNIAFDGSLRGKFLLEFHRADALMLAERFLQQPTDEFGPEQSESLLVVVRQAMSKCCSLLAQEYGSSTFQASSASELASDFTKLTRFTIADADVNRASIQMYLNSELNEALGLVSGGECAPEGAKETISSSARKALPEQVNLNLVMDVELNVTLRFGQRQMTLREVLELTSGSVVELDRQVEEPVELLLEGKVIAKGEAVVIDGNYGLRVTEVLQPIFPTGIPRASQ
jgi:flagellar motor switch protein FliN